jgi:hypothetical protein
MSIKLTANVAFKTSARASRKFAGIKKTLLSMTVGGLLLAAGAGSAAAAPGDSIRFKMVPSAGAKACILDVDDARGRVTISDLGSVQNMHVEVFGLPKNTSFTVFVIQVPTAPFGLVWYQGDIDTNKHGRGVGDFAGIFSIETFIMAPGVAPAPKVFPDNATSNPATAPVQTYHLGIWFADPKDAAKAGCPGTVTPFDGDHEAGIQVLNTSNFKPDHGPLLDLQ